MKKKRGVTAFLSPFSLNLSIEEVEDSENLARKHSRKHIFRIFGPPYISMFLVLKISKNWHFLTYPTSAYVIYEWSPTL